MTQTESCPCALCQQGADAEAREHHRHLRLLMSRLDEQQRRWLAGVECLRIGRGGEVLVAMLTGLDRKTVRRGRREVEAGLRGVPAKRVRREGAGRKTAEKNDHAR